jgi:transposase
MTSDRETELLNQLKLKDEELARLSKENTLLRQKVDAMARRLFGVKSEKLSPAQMQLLLQEIESPGPAEGKESGSQPKETELRQPKKVPARKERRPRIPEHLPVVEEVLKPEQVKAEPERWRCIDPIGEVSTRIDYEPARFFQVRTLRPKYVERGVADAVPINAPLPKTILERGIAAPGLVAQVVVAKYCDHLPLYRQESIYWNRHQVWLPRQTLSEWVGLAAFWLKPIYQEIQKEVFSKGYVQIDETVIRLLAPGTGKTKQTYFWVANDPKGDSVFHWEPGRAASCLEKIVPGDFKGIIQRDGYEGYDCFAKTRKGQIKMAGCMAHTRRKFDEAKGYSPRLAGWFLRQFQHLYAIESKLRDERAGPNLRQAVRQHQSRPIMDRLHRAMIRLKTKNRILPQSPIGTAINYALGQWPSLLVFLENGQIEIDNNGVENAIRPTAIGKKNWLFVGDEEGGEHSAIIYTIIEACRRRSINPWEYLRDVLTRLPCMTNHQVKDLTPEAWAKDRQKQVLAAAA